MRRITPIWWFTAALFLGLLCPALMQKGMFLDGVTYAAIARNMAEGWGRFSAPYYTATLFPVFYEQPPLAIWLESMPFRFVGDRWWVEGIYCTLLAMVTAWAITALWRMFYPGSGAWKPLWWWICTPVVFWGYQNNLLECTMSLFVLLSVRSSLLAVQKKGEKHLLIAAFWGVCAILSKGPVGLMALAAPWIATMASTSAEGWKGGGAQFEDGGVYDVDVRSIAYSNA